MSTIDKMSRSVRKFYSDLQKDQSGRYRSWEHCYFRFCNARNEKEPDIDTLSIHLAFYLASWGMYRGSSFLLQKDYRVHVPVVEKILDSKYTPLVGIECSHLRLTGNQKLLDEVTQFIAAYYEKIRRETKGINLQNAISDTLVTKILMGTLGCVPAYDRYFIAGIRNEKIAIGRYNNKSLGMLINFYERHLKELEALRSKMKVYNLPYPQMKVLDMGFWGIGYETDLKTKQRSKGV